MSEKMGKLIVVSGPSGVGKSTVISRVLERRNDLWFSVSATTREPRPGEREGVDYYYISRETFEQMIAEDALLEHAEYVGNLYGTPRAYVEENRRKGLQVLLDIEVQGASQVLQRAPEAVKIFVIPPSLKVLEERLRGRGTDSEERIQSRLKRAREEYREATFYDYIVVNDNLEIAAAELDAIITSELCRYDERQEYLNREICD